MLNYRPNRKQHLSIFKKKNQKDTTGQPLRLEPVLKSEERGGKSRTSCASYKHKYHTQ